MNIILNINKFILKRGMQCLVHVLVFLPLTAMTPLFTVYLKGMFVFIFLKSKILFKTTMSYYKDIILLLMIKTIAHS